jgi:acetylornithine deacetylase/succinyl-diaminopimelate desuccinylase-like protein
MLKEITEEATNLLSDLLRIDTTNPPGKEIEAAKYMAKNLEKDDFKCELFESAPGRGSIITRLKGTGKKPSLLLLSHLDVVTANPKEWSVDPFSGLVKDGFIWGRGALDMKSMTVMETIVLKLLKRNNVNLKGDVILAATADEEKGGEAGAGWLVQNYPGKILADYVINEGGGTAIPIAGKKVYTIQTAEKGIYWFKVKAKGRPGHGSMPGTADNAILRMNKIIDILGNHHAKITIIPTVKQFLTEVAKQNPMMQQAVALMFRNPEKSDEVIDMFAHIDKNMAEEIRARLRMTIAPTMIKGGVKENIIPSECEAVFDCRILPGQTTADAMNTVKDLLKDIDLNKLEFETIQANNPSESTPDTPLYKLIVDVLKEFEPECAVAPTMLTGGTDSRFFRKLGSTCYGFQPLRPDMPYGEMLKTIHGIDERISIENLVFGTSILYNVVERFMT